MRNLDYNANNIRITDHFLLITLSRPDIGVNVISSRRYIEQRFISRCILGANAYVKIKED